MFVILGPCLFSLYISFLSFFLFFWFPFQHVDGDNDNDDDDDDDEWLFSFRLRVMLSTFPPPVLSLAADAVKDLEGTDALSGLWTCRTSPFPFLLPMLTL